MAAPLAEVIECRPLLRLYRRHTGRRGGRLPAPVSAERNSYP